MDIIKKQKTPVKLFMELSPLILVVGVLTQWLTLTKLGPGRLAFFSWNQVIIDTIFNLPYLAVFIVSYFIGHQSKRDRSPRNLAFAHIIVTLIGAALLAYIMLYYRDYLVNKKVIMPFYIISLFVMGYLVGFLNHKWWEARLPTKLINTLALVLLIITPIPFRIHEIYSHVFIVDGEETKKVIYMNGEYAFTNDEVIDIGDIEFALTYNVDKSTNMMLEDEVEILQIDKGAFIQRPAYKKLESARPEALNPKDILQPLIDGNVPDAKADYLKEIRR